MALVDSASMEFEDSDVIEIISAEEYDSQRAKLKASISWILAKAYGTNIPSPIKEPFYENAKGQLQLKPQLLNLLASSELYCQACSNMFTDTLSQWQGHWSIIQVLSRKGIYVTDTGEAVVTETVLMHTAPFKVAAHLALIDALMKAYASEIASVEKVVQAVRKYANFNASSELPGTVEEALLFWVNKTCAALASRGDLESEIIQGESNQKVRIISKTPTREARIIPKMEDLMSDLGDGCCAAAVIAFYQPENFSIKDICLKESVGIADSLYNLRLIRTFCERHLALKCFHFTYEDLLYGRDNLRENVVIFLAELFFLLEAMQEHGDAGLKEKAVEVVSHVGMRRHPSPSLPQISSATKRSFQKNADDGRHHVDKFSTSPSNQSGRQPLLPKRTPGRRSLSLSSPQERDTVRRSVLAWQDDQNIKERTSHASTLLENVSISWDADATDPELETVSSADLAEFETTGHLQPHQSNLSDPHHPEFMEAVSVSPSRQRSTPRSMLSERLMPAKLRPAKEKVNSHSKAEERGDRTARKKAVTSPTTPKVSIKGKLSPPGGTDHGRTSPGGVTGSVCSGGGESGTQRSSGSSSSMDETIVTPLASVDLNGPGIRGDASSTDGPTLASRSGQQQTMTSYNPPYEAFRILPDSSAELPFSQSPRLTVSSAGVRGERPTTSYTLESTIHDSHSAREAGLPIIGRSAGDHLGEAELTPRVAAVGASREGSVASSRSSGDYSDHESHKIHQDHKARESLKHSPRRAGEVGSKPLLSQPVLEGSKPGPLIMDQLPEGGKRPGTTSFAEIRRLKGGLGNVDNSGYVYMQHGEQQQQGGGPATQRAGQSGVGVKKTSFSRLPNETTWRMSSQQTATGAATSSGGNNGGGGGDDPSANPSQLSQLKLKLEEKRREIERNKQRQEMATAKMRQRMGKLAFLRVISKQDDLSRGVTSALSTQSGLLGAGLSGGGDLSNNSSVSSGLSGSALHERLEHSPRPATLATRSNSSSTSTSASQSPSGAGTSAADGVPVSQLSNDMMQSCPPSMAAAAFGYSSPPVPGLGQEGARNSPILLDQGRRSSETDSTHGTSSTQAAAQHRQLRELSQSPRSGNSPERGPAGSGEQEDYDQSLDKLNKSLTELQGEIKRLSLQQQEQFRAAKSPLVSQQGLAGAESELQQQPQFHFHPAGPHHHQQYPASQPPAQHPPQLPPSHELPSVPSHQLPSVPSHQLPSVPSQPRARTVVGPVSGPTSHSQHASFADPFNLDSLFPASRPSPPTSSSANHLPEAAETGSTGEDGFSQEDDSSSGNGGFFVSFGEESAPRRPRPKLGKDRERDGSAVRKDSWGGGLAVGDERVPPLHGGAVLPSSGVGSAYAAGGERSSSHSGSYHSLGSDDGSPSLKLLVGQETEAGGSPEKQTEMEKKKERLFVQQQKRKEEHERKRMEKELETQRKLQEKMQKDEEHARKKSEEKARKEAIFQQYLQKKMDQDDPPPAPVTKRDRSAHSAQPRPKSMFVKARPPAPDFAPVSAVGMAMHSSQEDLSLMKSPPGVLRSYCMLSALSPFRLNPNSRGSIRKAVSTSQLTQNGIQGATTYRRPQSPGQGRRPPSPGPKLFVKPSAKSNRHIIINALSYCCLAGIVNNDLKNKVLEEIARATAKHFLIMFRDHGCQYRGLYSFDPDSEEAYKIVGVGPRLVTSDMVEKFYKYNSGGKSFNEVTSTKHLSVSIDAVVLMNAYWKTKPPSAAAAASAKK